MNALQKFIVEQAVYLKAHSKNSPWNLNEEVRHVAEAIKSANEQIKEKGLQK